MSRKIHRRDFVKATAAAGLGAALPAAGAAAQETSGQSRSAPEVLVRKAARPLVISDVSGIDYTNDGPESAVERAFRLMTEGSDVLEALIEGVNIPENDPTEMGIGYGGLPNAEGIVQLDACCMHGPRRWAGGVAALEGVRTPSRVAKAVMELTDHHLLVGEGAREFARDVGFTVEDSLLTDRARERWLEWRRRVDPSHWLDPEERLRGVGGEREETDPDVIRRPPLGGAGSREHGEGARRPLSRSELQARHDAWYRAGLEMVEEGLIPAHSFLGTINCNGLGPTGDICGVTTTSGLSWKIPGRVGDSPILGAGLYVDDAVGACGSTGRGEANLYNLSSFLVVENMRRGMHPTDAGMDALQRIRENTVEERLLNSRGEPAFDVRFFILNKAGDYAGVAMYGARESEFAVCTENGAEKRPLEGLLSGSPSD